MSGDSFFGVGVRGDLSDLLPLLILCGVGALMVFMSAGRVADYPRSVMGWLGMMSGCAMVIIAVVAVAG
jgi:hypothetical protein